MAQTFDFIYIFIRQLYLHFYKFFGCFAEHKKFGGITCAQPSKSICSPNNMHFYMWQKIFSFNNYIF